MAVVILVSVVAFACTSARSSVPILGRDLKRPIDGPVDLATLLICTDSLGIVVDEPKAALCTPCIPYPNGTALETAVRHSRRLMAQAPSLPMVRDQRYLQCIRHGFDLSIAARRSSHALRAEAAGYEVFSQVSGIRADAIRSVDVTVDTLIAVDDSLHAAYIVELFARAIWERSQRLLSRADIGVDTIELEVHHLGKALKSLRRLPMPPAPSKVLGVSEAHWASALFSYSAQLAVRADSIRTRMTRLALAPYVVLEDWGSLDSAARVVLASHPRDSVAPIARALARFHRITHPMREYPVAMATFDSALRALPRVDSAAYDDFNEILKQQDDRWREQHFISDRIELDDRSWALFDPIWLTPVNELHLVRRARMADANFRYAHLAKSGQSGSEVPLGIILLRRGVPEVRWRYRRTADGHDSFVRTWPGGYSTQQVFSGDTAKWTVFYTDEMTLPVRVLKPLDKVTGCASPVPTLYLCARADNASWFDVPFEARQDTIDVTAARFRSSADSLDYYFGARIPLRKFMHRDDTDAERSDSIIYGATIATARGIQQFQQRATRDLPRFNEVAFHSQWRARVPVGDIMHRIEAYEPRKLASARGSRMLTSVGAATYVTSGFGMSDVLVADSISQTRRTARNWRDLRTVANGGVTAPGGGVAMGWEIYGLTRGADGRSRWRVTLSREDGRAVVNMDVRSLIIGDPEAGVKVVSAEPDATMLSFVRNEPSQPVMVEYIRFRMPDVGTGRHVLRVRIEDLLNNRVTQKSVSVRVLDPKTQARQQRQ
jgi:hypothetical protein